MKQLEMVQMEALQGGRKWDPEYACGLGVGLYLSAIALASVATGGLATIAVIGLGAAGGPTAVIGCLDTIF